MARLNLPTQESLYVIWGNVVGPLAEPVLGKAQAYPRYRMPEGT
jgi:hypothetical protein